MREAVFQSPRTALLKQWSQPWMACHSRSPQSWYNTWRAGFRGELEEGPKAYICLGCTQEVQRWCLLLYVCRWTSAMWRCHQGIPRGAQENHGLQLPWLYARYLQCGECERKVPHHQVAAQIQVSSVPSTRSPSTVVYGFLLGVIKKVLLSSLWVFMTL